MPKSELNMIVYARTEDSANTALRSLEESMVNDFREKDVNDALIKDLTKDQARFSDFKIIQHSISLGICINQLILV